MASESKMKDQEDYLRSLPQVDVTGVEISPNPAPLHEKLNLEVDFTLDTPVEGLWRVKVCEEGGKNTASSMVNILHA